MCVSVCGVCVCACCRPVLLFLLGIKNTLKHDFATAKAAHIEHWLKMR